MSIWKRRWFLRRLAPALAVVAVVAPSASAYPVQAGTSDGAGTQPALTQKESTPSPYHHRNHRSTVAEEARGKIGPQIVPVSNDDGGLALPAPAVAAAVAIAFALIAAGTMTVVQLRIRRAAA
jgi:hypothetical protein